jgi:predicted nucleic acid-binding protein
VRYVLDASVAVAAAHPNEPTHALARSRLVRVLAGEDEIVVPALFPIEVAAALSRTGSPATLVENFVTPLVAAPTKIFTIGPRAALRIQHMAMRLKLRAADATYVWLAMRQGVPLITSDTEILERASGVCQVDRP